MVDDNNGPQAPYLGPDEDAPDTGESHGSGLEQAESEPKQSTAERPVDWDPPPDNPGSDQTPRPTVTMAELIRLKRSRKAPQNPAIAPGFMF